MKLKFIQQDKSLQSKASKNLFKKLANSVIESSGIKWIHKVFCRYQYMVYCVKKALQFSLLMAKTNGWFTIPSTHGAFSVWPRASNPKLTFLKWGKVPCNIFYSFLRCFFNLTHILFYGTGRKTLVIKCEMPPFTYYCFSFFPFFSFYFFPSSLCLPLTYE